MFHSVVLPHFSCIWLPCLWISYIQNRETFCFSHNIQHISFELRHKKPGLRGLQPGPSCSKLTMSLVNVSLKFQTLILQIHCHFLLKKCENPLHCKGFSHFFNKICTAKDSHIFSTKNNSVFVTLADICLTNLCLNDIVKLTML